MAEPKEIVVEPTLSDGSEESWILLDEMDAAMNEEFMSQTSSGDQSDSVHQTISTETLTGSNIIEEIESNTDESVPHPPEVDESVDEAPYVAATSSVEVISASNDEGDCDVDENACLKSVLEKKRIITLQVLDDPNDGSTTDGSISILGDQEINHEPIESDEVLSDHTGTPQPMQMWMRCTPIDMTICAKRPFQARPRNDRRCAQPTSVEELGLPQQNILEDLQSYLDRLNNLLTRVYLMPVLLFFIAAGTLSVLYGLNARYTAAKLEIKELEHKLYTMTTERYKIEGNLNKCEYLYEMELDKASYANTDFRPENEYIAKSMPAVRIPKCKSSDSTSECGIRPTKLSDSYGEEHDNNIDKKYSKAVWDGAGNIIHVTTTPIRTKESNNIDCNDENNLFSEYNREYCENLKNSGDLKPKIQSQEEVYSTLYKGINDKECNLDKINFKKGIEHARKVLRATKCDDEGTMKYLQEMFDNYQTKSKGDKFKNKDDKKIENTNGKWDKTQKVEHSVIKTDKYDENLSDERFDHHDKKHRQDKENKQRKHDRKDNRKQDKDQGKWNKNDRKVVKVYDQRHDD